MVGAYVSVVHDAVSLLVYFGWNSFTVPYDLSMQGENEPWAEEFLSRMQLRFEKCSKVWKNLQLEVSHSYPQSIVL